MRKSILKNTLSLFILTVAGSITTYSQTAPQPTPIADETLRLCVASVQTRQFEAALRDCSNSITKSPGKHDGYQLRAIANANLKNIDAAIADISKAIQIAPNSGDALAWRGEIYIAAQKYDLALVDFNKVLQLFPNNPGALYRRAVIYSNTGKKDLAVADLKAILATNPNSADVKNALAQLEASMKPFMFEGRQIATADGFVKEAEIVYFQSGAYAGMPFKWSERERYFTLLSNCVVRFPDHYDCAKKTLDFYDKETWADSTTPQGGLDARTKFAGSPAAKWIETNAVVLYSALLKKEPNNTTAYFKRAAAYHELKNYDAAAADLTKVIEGDPKGYLYYAQRSKVYLAQRKFDLALADIDKALANTADGTWKLIYQRDRIDINLAAQRYEDLMKDADKLLERDPKSGYARLARGIALRAQGKNDLAIAEFTSGIRDNPGFVQIFVERAATYRLMGKNDLAAADENKAAQLKTGK